MRKLDFGRLRAAQRDQAVNEVKASMILDKVAEAEGVTVSDDEMDRELLMLSLQRASRWRRCASGCRRTAGWIGFASRCGARRLAACCMRS